MCQRKKKRRRKTMDTSLGRDKEKFASAHRTAVTVEEKVSLFTDRGEEESAPSAARPQMVADRRGGRKE